MPDARTSSPEGRQIHFQVQKFPTTAAILPHNSNRDYSGPGYQVSPRLMAAAAEVN